MFLGGVVTPLLPLRGDGGGLAVALVLRVLSMIGETLDDVLFRVVRESTRCNELSSLHNDFLAVVLLFFDVQVIVLLDTNLLLLEVGRILSCPGIGGGVDWPDLAPGLSSEEETSLHCTISSLAVVVGRLDLVVAGDTDADGGGNGDDLLAIGEDTAGEDFLRIRVSSLNFPPTLGFG